MWQFEIAQIREMNLSPLIWLVQVWFYFTAIRRHLAKSCLRDAKQTKEFCRLTMAVRRHGIGLGKKPGLKSGLLMPVSFNTSNDSYIKSKMSSKYLTGQPKRHSGQRGPESVGEEACRHCWFHTASKSACHRSVVCRCTESQFGSQARQLLARTNP